MRMFRAQVCYHARHVGAVPGVEPGKKAGPAVSDSGACFWWICRISVRPAEALPQKMTPAEILPPPGPLFGCTSNSADHHA